MFHFILALFFFYQSSSQRPNFLLRKTFNVSSLVKSFHKVESRHLDLFGWGLILWLPYQQSR